MWLHAKQAKISSLDLTPWRSGSKHRTVCASVPLKTGWNPGRVHRSGSGYDKHAFETAFAQRPPASEALSSAVSQFVASHIELAPADLNAEILQHNTFQVDSHKEMRRHGRQRLYRTVCVTCGTSTGTRRCMVGCLRCIGPNHAAS